MNDKVGLRLYNRLKQLFYIHRKEILCIDTAIADNERGLWMEKLSELIQAVRSLLGIAFDLDGYDRTFFAKDKIYLVISFAPIEYLETMDKCLADKIGSDTRFEDMPPCSAVENGLLKRERTIYHF